MKDYLLKRRQIDGCQGLTLVELMLTLVIVGVLAGMGIPAYQDYKERIRISQAIADITIIAAKINAYYEDDRAYPESLAVIGAEQLDPWGRMYEYKDLTSKGNGGSRRDKKLNPLNTYFDLYSRGKDGKTKLQISQKDSLDDVLRANDGGFIDLASKY
jgi:general secretion pathway protein G